MKKKKTAKQVQYQNGKAAIKIEFPFDRNTVQRVKTLPWRKFHNTPDGKYWSCPLTPENVNTLAEWGFELDEKLQKFFKFSNTPIEETPEAVVPGMEGILYPYQKQGVGFIDAKDGRALIGDDMGLGKTLQAIAYLQLHPEARPALIVVPKVVKLKWQAEIIKWMDKPGKIQVLDGKTPYNFDADITIINYAILYEWTDPKNNGVLGKKHFDTVIIDECHYIKNNKAKRTQAVKALGKAAKRFIALSGTPIENRPIEIYNAVNLINPNLFPNYIHFGKKYCAGEHNGWGWKFDGASNLSELNNILKKSVMIRRKKHDVLTELPDKQYSYVPFEIQNRPDYNHAKDDLLSYIIDKKGAGAAKKAVNAEVLVKLETLKQVAAEGKLDQVIEWIEDFLESGEKLVVFGVHKNVINKIYKRFQSIAAKVDGSTTDREAEFQRFQTDPDCRLFVGNIKAAGVGIELTAASNVAVIELPWTPGALDQAIDRLHRIGQEFAVMVHYLLAQQTIEMDLAQLIDKKRNVVSQALDGIEVENSDLISELIDNMLEAA